MQEAPCDRRTLNNGVEMPVLGLGTYQADEGGEVEQAVHWALELGYRSIDTASVYENETGVGQALRESDVPRADVFVTSKVWNDQQGYEDTLQAFNETLGRLQMDYLDLYLVHWPVKGEIRETWRALETIYDQGLARSIGVSNFLESHLTKLLETAEVKPAVNQIEFHPRLQQRGLIEFCAARDVQIEAWSPLMKGKVVKLPELKRIGEKHDKSAAQVTLRWQIQRGLITIPKSVQQEHLRSNLLIFDFSLDEDDMRDIHSLDQGERTGPDPATFGQK